MKRFHHIKKTRDGRTMVNLGCGPRTHPEWNNVDFSPYAWLARYKRLAGWLHARGLLSDTRYDRVQRVGGEIVRWDLRRGIPFGDGVFNVVYHSHFITQLEREEAAVLTREACRVLKPGGILRVVVPDLQEIIRRYGEAAGAIERGDPAGPDRLREATDDLFELMVRRQARGTSEQRPFVRLIERYLRGDVARRGELRRWHYDRYSLGEMLRRAGFARVRPSGPDESLVDGWNAFGLDLNEDGSIYKPGSLYMEGVK